MNDRIKATDEFEKERPHLRAVAVRLLGSTADADDAVQEAWLRFDRHTPGAGEAIDNVPAWLTTVVARICLDTLRARSRSRVDGNLDAAADAAAPGPESAAELAAAVGEALAVVIGALQPAERVAFVLHDTFAVPFDEIGAVLGRSPSAAKQLASRARHKVRGESVPTVVEPADHRRVVDAFLAASRSGNLEDLVAILHPDVVLHADAAGLAMGASAPLHGAAAVAGTFSGRAQGATAATADGLAAIAWIVGGSPKVLWEVTIEDGLVTRMDMIADPDTLMAIDVRSE